MLPFFIFNQVNSLDKKVLVTKLPPISKAERNYNEIEVPGRNGTLYIDKNTYKSFSYSIECTLLEGANIRDIAKWLNGSGKLTICTELDKFYNVIIKNQIDFEQTYKVFNEFTVVFEIEPISYGIEEKILNLEKETMLTITESTYEIKPYIRINANGNVTFAINDKNIVIENINAYIELDCELEEAYKNMQSCNNLVNCEKFPSLLWGENRISWIGNVSSVQIKYREAFI